jgi:hypothetical protein
MVELLSYWKSCCSPQIEIEANSLDAQELAYWEHLIRHGLGEFFFVNHISPDIEFSITSSSPKDAGEKASAYTPAYRDNSQLILVGGGKDSVVTLEVIKRALHHFNGEITAFALNPIPASIEAVHAANYPAPLVARRTMDPLLRTLNSQGYLNGHTPFSALLAFIATLTAYANGFHRVLASNEASASEGNTEFAGFEINHQYSKSFEFEQGFRKYLSRLDLPVDYLSFLRPINELQICSLFSEIKHQHPIFRSCNREQTLAAQNRSVQSGQQLHRSGWCARCPKCVFTFLCLRCFLPDQEIRDIFGVDPTAMPEFGPLITELAGFSEHKPFECVGTYEEVRACLAHLVKEPHCSLATDNRFTAIRERDEIASATPLLELLHRWNPNHFLDPLLESALRDALLPSQGRLQT